MVLNDSILEGVEMFKVSFLNLIGDIVFYNKIIVIVIILVSDKGFGVFKFVFSLLNKII